MISEQQLTDVSLMFDEIFMQIAEKYEMSSLELAAIALARLVRLTEDFKQDKDFRLLMGEAIVTTSKRIQETRTIQ